MPHLARPTTLVYESFLVAMTEFQAEGRGRPGDDTVLGTMIREKGWMWATPSDFEALVRWLLDDAREESPRREGFVPSTTLWWVDDREYLGRVGIRHRLTPELLERGGNIGYDVRPSARRRGHATAMLRAALPIARAIGIEQALLTCDADNVASAKVITANGGVFEDRRGNKLRFWVPTRA